MMKAPIVSQKTTKMGSDVDYPLPPALTRNPQTGEWEELTTSQWHRLKHGFQKDDTSVDTWHLHALDGGEISIRFAFDLHHKNDEGCCAWLVSLLKDWPRKINTGILLYEWREFILDIYDFDKRRTVINEAYQLMMQMRREQWERNEAKKEHDKYNLKQAEKIAKEIRKLKHTRTRKQRR